MLKTLLALCGAALIAVPSLHAQGARSFSGGHQAAYSGGGRSYAGRSYGYRGGYRGGYGGGHYYGRNYYLGGVGYFYPYYGGFGYGLGFGYPAYAYDGFWNGYAGSPYGYGGYGDDGYGGGYGGQGAYEGRVTDQGAAGQQQGASLTTAVQRQLSKRGYYKGKVNGDFGASSRSALSQFQRDNHLKDTGRIDEDTLEKLGFSDRR